MNRNLCKHIHPIPIKRGSKKQAKGPKLTTPTELQKFYARVMQLENTFGNEAPELREHLNVMKEQFGAIPKLGMKCFIVLWESLDPTVEELDMIAKILTKAAWRY